MLRIEILHTVMKYLELIVSSRIEEEEGVEEEEKKQQPVTINLKESTDTPKSSNLTFNLKDSTDDPKPSTLTSNPSDGTDDTSFPLITVTINPMEQNEVRY